MFKSARKRYTKDYIVNHTRHICMIYNGILIGDLYMSKTSEFFLVPTFEAMKDVNAGWSPAGYSQIGEFRGTWLCIAVAHLFKQANHITLNVELINTIMDQVKRGKSEAPTHILYKDYHTKSWYEIEWSKFVELLPDLHIETHSGIMLDRKYCIPLKHFTKSNKVRFKGKKKGTPSAPSKAKKEFQAYKDE